jgi:ATP-dependent helicase HrpB
LLRFLGNDPALADTALVIFDEFHERSLDADLGLALTLDAKRFLRPDLRLLIMSATLDGGAAARLLGEAPVIAATGRAFDVELRYLGNPSAAVEPAIVAAIRTALADDPGGILAFLPGGAEIRRVERMLREGGLADDVILSPLYGDLPHAAQDQAIRPAPAGRRKLVLATSIAETSLTIEGIAIVIDSGLMRVPRFEPASGMTRLATVRVSQASSEQRRGRAGRLSPGICYRLWRAAEQAQLAPFNRPEILEADLAPLALTLAQWGDANPEDFSWLDPPPAPAYAEARALLRRLGALDDRDKITAAGSEMAGMGLPPRLAHMMVRGRDWGMGRLAAALAALLIERDLVKGSDADLRLRVELLVEPKTRRGLPPGLAVEQGALERAKQAMRQYERTIRSAGNSEVAIEDTGRLIAQAFPDRIAQARPGARGQFLLANGRGASLPASDALAGEEFLAVSDLDGEKRVARIFLAAPLARAALEADFAAEIETADSIGWDAREAAVLARRRQKLGAVILKDEALANPPPAQIAAALIAGIRALGIESLPWPGAAEHLRRRVRFLRALEGTANWPDLSDTALTASLEAWLAPSLAGMTRRTPLAGIDLAAALAVHLTPEQRRALDRRAPTHIRVPSGSTLPIDYEADVPVLAVRIQELFGAENTPAIADGKVPLLLHLLSPAGRPLQMTRDLVSFWRTGYAEIRRTMRGRYPRHPWPENPAAALPTARAKKRAP